VNLDAYQQALHAQREAHALRSVRVFEPTKGMCGRFAGQSVVNFCSNDYLGLSHHPQLQAAATQAIASYGTGARAARLVSGSSPALMALEADLAAWKGTEAALVFNSGYQANVGILQAMLGSGDFIFGDRLNHASLVDGCVLSRATLKRYRHNDMDHLVELLRLAPAGGQKWIVTDSVFSMDGDVAPLTDLVTLAEDYDALVMVDEAHATGLYGKTHSGMCEAMGVQNRVALQMGTFSKAMGGFGAYVAGPQVLIDTLINRARSWIYSTALPPSVVAANHAAVELVQRAADLHASLWANRRRLEGLVPVGPWPSPIVPVILGDNATTLEASTQLLAAGVFVQAIRPPTVPPESARLRITVSAAHTANEIDQLLDALQPLRAMV
jgi:8-amino-7-oxononanoate synthase